MSVYECVGVGWSMGWLKRKAWTEVNSGLFSAALFSMLDPRWPGSLGSSFLEHIYSLWWMAHRVTGVPSLSGGPHGLRVAAIPAVSLVLRPYE